MGSEQIAADCVIFGTNAASVARPEHECPLADGVSGRDSGGPSRRMMKVENDGATSDATGGNGRDNSGGDKQHVIKSIAMPIGVVVTRTPGVTRWAKHNWRATAVLPGAAPADWRVMRKEGDAVEFHAATVTLELFRTDTEAYLAALACNPPQVWVILRPSEDPGDTEDVVVHSVTASPFDAQDYLDSGEEIVEGVPMPQGLVAWVQAFCDDHHVEEEFIKRRRDRVRTDRIEDGKGDPRIRQTADVYRAPGALKPKRDA
jgi:hypothetical protein